MARRLPQKSLQATLVEVLDERVPAFGPWRRKSMSKREVVLAQLMRYAEEGNESAEKLVLDLLRSRRGN